MADKYQFENKLQVILVNKLLVYINILVRITSKSPTLDTKLKASTKNY